VINPDFTLRLQNLEKRVKEDYLRFWQVHAPHYTDHGETHCEAVEINLNELIPDDVKETMNEYEVFLLLSSVLLHDIGLMCANATGEKIGDIRSKHHERSREFISKNLADLLNFHERLIIGEISYSHRDFILLEKIDDIKIIRHSKLGDIKIRVGFLSSLLRFADACDMCHTRTSEELTGLSKLSEESAFYHNLHERVSGIDFNQQNKSIALSINIGSSKERAICERFIVEKLKKCFNTVRDVFIRNNIFYVDIIAKYSIQDFLVPLSVPASLQRTRELVPFEIDRSELESRAREAYLEDDHPKTIKLLEKVIKDKPTDLFYLQLLAQSSSRAGNLKKASEYFDQIIKLNPDNSSYWSGAGHFFGEIELDTEKSFKCLKKAYELNPRDIHPTLNFAEALNTTGEYVKAYRLATKIWRKTKEVEHLRHAQIIRICSLFFQSKREEGLKEIHRFLNFCRGLPEPIKESWIYNKIRKYIQDNLSETKDKELLTTFLDFVEDKVTIDNFEKMISEKEDN